MANFPPKENVPVESFINEFRELKAELYTRESL